MPKMKITGYVEIPEGTIDPYMYASAHRGDMKIENIEPEGEIKARDDGRERHPSYGVIEISRGESGGGRALFGSSILHSSTISIRIREASLERSLSYDSIHPEGRLVEIELSQSQFADMITSMNVGGGTPCTFRWIRHKGGIENCPFKDKRKQFEDELSENIDKANLTAERLIDKVTTLLDGKKTLTKSDKEAINALLRKLANTIGSDRKFIYTSFNEQMDATVKEAKGEVESFMQNKILRAVGIELENHDTPLVNIESDNNREMRLDVDDENYEDND